MRKRTAGLACTLVLACVVVAGCTRVTGGRAVPADHDGPRPVAASALPELLLDAATVSDIMGAPGMRVKDARTKMFDEG
ncbi:sensor domain-containing protein, partial [Mycolicibacter sp. MYC017]|nr:sensor domain-containing protein [Mycolicibacter sp. MYC017]